MREGRSAIRQASDPEAQLSASFGSPEEPTQYKLVQHVRSNDFISLGQQMSTIYINWFGHTFERMRQISNTVTPATLIYSFKVCQYRTDTLIERNSIFRQKLINSRIPP